MPTICPEALKLPDLPKGSLSLMKKLPGTTSATHSKPCRSYGEGMTQLRTDLQEKAEALAAQMECPKAVIILTHKLASFELHSLDVLTGKSMELDDDAPWGGDGKVLAEDRGSESESELDDDAMTL